MVSKKMIQEAIAEAKAMAFNADGSSKKLTDAEQKALADKVERIEALKADYAEDERLRAAIGEAPVNDGTDAPNDLSMYGALKAAGFGLGRPGNIENGTKAGQYFIPFDNVAKDYGRKSDLIATQGNAGAPLRVAMANLGIDGRHVFPAFPATDIGLETTQVQFLQQTTRTLPTIADIDRALDSSATKELVDSVAQLVTAEPVWLPVISNPQPNALFAQPALRDMLSRDMALAYRKALDLQIVDAIDAATTTTRAQGADTTTDAIYKAAQDVADAGFVPSVAVIGSATFTALVLTKDGDDHYMNPFAAGQPLEGIRPVVAPEGDLPDLSTKIFVCDPSVVEVFRSGVAFEANTALYFETNRTVARLEGLAVSAVKQGTGICELTLA